MIDGAAVLSRIAASAAMQIQESRPLYINDKAQDDFVTDLDKRLEVEISSRLSEEFPGVPVLGEEGLSETSTLPEDTFLVDPLDGTLNWITGISFCAVSIARVTSGRSVWAAVADVYGKNLYTASHAGGAFKNGNILRVTSKPFPLFGLSSGLLSRTHTSPGVFERLRAFGKMRNLGAQALQLCLVADGRLAFNASVEAKLWDDAAGRLIVAEAGAVYSAGVESQEANVPFSEQKSLAAHPAIANEITGILSPLLGRPRA